MLPLFVARVEAGELTSGLGQAREIGHCGADGKGDGSVRFSGIGTGQLAFVGASCHGEQEGTKAEGG